MGQPNRGVKPKNDRNIYKVMIPEKSTTLYQLVHLNTENSQSMYLTLGAISLAGISVLIHKYSKRVPDKYEMV